MRRVLGVRAVLRATVMPGADKLEVRGELVDARDGSHIWGIYSEMALRLARFQLQRWEEWLGFILEGTETIARQAASAAVQILHLFEADRKKIQSLGRKTASALLVHEYMQGHTLIKIGPTAKALKLSVPTVTGALESLATLKIAKEATGKRRDRLFAYPRYLHILSEGTEPLK